MWSTWLEYTRNDNHKLVVGQILTVLSVVLIIFLHRRTFKRPTQSIPLPPGPTGLPLVGYLPFLGQDLHRQFTQLSSLYGPIFKLWLGKRLCIVISSPSLAKEVFRDHDTVFSNHDMSATGYIATYGGNDIVFTPYGPEWKKLRKIFVREMLSNGTLESLYGLRREEVKKSVRHIYDVVKAGTQVDFGRLAFLTGVNAILSMICGGSTVKIGENTINGAEFKRLATELMVLFGKPNVSDLFPGLAWLDLQGIARETKKVVGVFDKMFDSTIEERKRAISEKGGEDLRNKRKKDFLQYLLEMIEQDNTISDTSISIAQLKALLMDFVVGGTDTTGTTLEWAMAELLKNPEAMNKVHEELTQVVGLTNTVEEFHLTKLTYLEAVIKETLRLHPPLPFLVPRCPSQSTTIGGYNVPKGARVFVNVWAIHMDPNYWENPFEFRPERFLNNSDDASKFDLSGHNFNYIPLGSGRRLCAGIPLAERMLKYVLASFLHSFEWKLPSGGKLETSERFGIVLKKREPLVIFPKPRLSNLELYA